MSTLISYDEMNQVYREMRTPIKMGFVLHEDGVNIDCATVFRAHDEWRMVFARHDPRQPEDRQGYETWMARSDNLIRWTVMGRVLSQTFRGWDGYQVDGGMLLIDPNWGGSMVPEQYEGRYWMSYIGGSLPGYETDPLQIGMATSRSIEEAKEWQRFEAPILRQNDPDARAFERATLYKSCVIRDPNRITGHDFVMYYNAKRSPFSVEAIGMAVSNDMRSWKRFGEHEIIDSGYGDGQWSIAGDPQIIRFRDLWVMHFFIAHSQEGQATAFDTFACSRDLVNWTPWEGEPLVKPSIPIDHQFAHKPFVLLHDGVVYHFYCACGVRGRGLALAVSKNPVQN